MPPYCPPPQVLGQAVPRMGPQFVVLTNRLTKIQCPGDPTSQICMTQNPLWPTQC